MKANWHPEILRRVYAAGLTLECVSQGEIEHAFAHVARARARAGAVHAEFRAARRVRIRLSSSGVRVTLDNLYPLKAWPEVFRGREIFVRIDPGFGRGHHHHVRTAGVHSKFGVPLAEMEELASARARRRGTRRGTACAHRAAAFSTSPTGPRPARLLAQLASHFPDVARGRSRRRHRGSRAGWAERHRSGARSMPASRSSRGDFPHIEFWMEPGRFLVAKAGVLVALVTQLKGKGETRYVGIATGMNSLIRPALYGAHHDIRNLTRLEQPLTDKVTIVGPICETADQLGSDRWLPPSRGGRRAADRQLRRLWLCDGFSL